MSENMPERTPDDLSSLDETPKNLDALLKSAGEKLQDQEVPDAQTGLQRLIDEQGNNNEDNPGV